MKTRGKDGTAIRLRFDLILSICRPQKKQITIPSSIRSLGMPKRRRLNDATEEKESVRVLPKRSHNCPICSMSFSISELQAHYSHERNLLSEPQPTNKRPAAVLALAKIVDRRRLPKRNEITNLLSRVRANRDSRRNNLATNDDEGEAEECPVCGLCLIGIGTSVEDHVSTCLDIRIQEERRNQDEGWDVYQVGGQTRVRAMGLLEGGVQSLPNAVIHTDVDDVMDVFVDVEGDAESVYGRTQYTEADLIDPTASPTSGKPSGLFP
jgi:hypothetical protein